jgi:hypothetical protein
MNAIQRAHWTFEPLAWKIFREGFDEAGAALQRPFNPDTDPDSDARELRVAIGIDGFEFTNPPHTGGLIMNAVQLELLGRTGPGRRRPEFLAELRYWF